VVTATSCPTSRLMERARGGDDRGLEYEAPVGMGGAFGGETMPKAYLGRCVIRELVRISRN
jgi:hypothetical protein